MKKYLYSSLKYIVITILLIVNSSCLFEGQKEFKPVVKQQEPILEPRFNIIVKNYCVPKSVKRVSFNLLNRNYHLSSIGILPDVDGDGITDTDEISKVSELFGISPESEDTNGDRYSDAIVYNGLLTLQKQGDLPPCGMEDTDFDGLPDCVENVIGTNNLSIDTDRDGIADELEIFLGTSPMIGDSHIDTDMDGLTNFEEITIGTPINETNFKGAIEKYKLQYDLKLMNSDIIQDCYDYHVNNITYVTKRNSLEPNNKVEFYFIEERLGQTKMFKYAKLIPWSEYQRLQDVISKQGSNDIPTFEINYTDLKEKD